MAEEITFIEGAVRMAIQTRWAEIEEAERNATRARRIAVRFPDWHPESWDQEELEEYLLLVGVKAPSSVSQRMPGETALPAAS